jgi:hypothetical protein
MCYSHQEQTEINRRVQAWNRATWPATQNKGTNTGKQSHCQPLTPSLWVFVAGSLGNAQLSWFLAMMLFSSTKRTKYLPSHPGTTHPLIFPIFPIFYCLLLQKIGGETGWLICITEQAPGTRDLPYLDRLTNADSAWLTLIPIWTQWLMLTHSDSHHALYGHNILKCFTICPHAAIFSHTLFSRLLSMIGADASGYWPLRYKRRAESPPKARTSLLNTRLIWLIRGLAS